MAGIVQSGDRNFWEVRAIEMIHDARRAYNEEGNVSAYHDRMTKAIALLALSKATAVPEQVDATVRAETANGTGS